MDMAAARTSVIVASAIVELSGLTSTAKRAAAGSSSCKSPRCLAASSRHGDDAGDITARLVKAGDETSLDRVPADLEDDRNCRGRSLGRKCRWCAGRSSDYGNSALNQFGCELRSRS